MHGSGARKRHIVIATIAIGLSALLLMVMVGMLYLQAEHERLGAAGDGRSISVSSISGDVEGEQKNSLNTEMAPEQLPDQMDAEKEWDVTPELKEEPEQEIVLVPDNAPADEIDLLPDQEGELTTEDAPTEIVLSDAEEKKTDEASPKELAVIPDKGKGLNPAPNKALLQESEYGKLPRKSKDGLTSWEYYGRYYDDQGMPSIAVVITGLGLNTTVTNKALRLSPEIALAISPYAEDAAVWALSARSSGHEILIDLPVEAEGYPDVDPGPLAQLAGQSPEANVERLRQVLASMESYIGVAMPADERFTMFPSIAKPSLKELSDRGLLLLQGTPTSEQSTSKTLRQVGVTYLQADMKLDTPLPVEEVENKLRSIESLARTRGYAIIVINSYPLMLDALLKWTQEIEKKGFSLAPVSALAK